MAVSLRAWRQIDPRLLQMATLATLLTLGIEWFDLDASWAQAIVTIAAALASEAALNRRGATWPAWMRHGWRAPLISALSLTLLLRTRDPLIWAASGVIAIGGKRLLALGGRHVVNPACLAIVTLLLATHEVWVSPGQWGALGTGAVAIGGAAGLVLSRANRLDVAAAFLGAWAVLLAARCLWLGDPWAIPLHQMQSGALLVFACFMITDPRTTPARRWTRILFAVTVAALGHWLQFFWQLREGLFYALASVSLAFALGRLMVATARMRGAALGEA
jgi:Na+-translocating ferredoxin:NAD+ oxidoreductase RnfD subunit